MHRSNLINAGIDLSPMATLNILGLILNFGGVILLFRYGMPYRVRTGGKTNLTVLTPSAENIVQIEHRYNWLGWLGLSCILLGTGLQIYVSAATLG